MQDTRADLNHSPSSFGAPSMPSPPCTVPLPNSGHIFSPDYPSSPPSSTSSKSRRFRLPLHTVAAAPFSEQSMGQNQSTVASPSQRLKRAFSTRRKKSGDESTYQDKEPDRVQSSVPPSPLSPTSPTTPIVAKHFSLFGYRKPSLLSSATPPNTLPPPLPTKPPALRAGTKSQSPADEHARPLIINSPGISATVQFMRQDEDENKSEETFVSRSERKAPAVEQMKEDWRKSDSTVASHHTIRPGAGGPHKSRPASAAESSHSGNTIVPMNKRVSILVTEAELDAPQENHDGSSDIYVAVPRLQSPSSVLHTQNRRSLSMKFGSALSFKAKPSPPELRIETPSDLQHVTPSRSREPLPVSYKAVAINTTAANGFIVPVNSHSAPSQPTGNQIRGRLAAWTAATSLPQNTEAPQSPPSSYPNRPTGHLKAPPNFRQTAVSISGSIAPAAMDLGKRAMEKMGRAWGSRGVGSSSGYSSSSGEPSSSKRRTADPAMGRHPNDSTPSQISSVSTSGKGKRRTPNAPSGSWSITSSSTSVSDSGPCPALSGINSSKCLRGPLSSGGLVFGRKLVDCVRDTAIDAVRLQLISGEYFGVEAGDNSCGMRKLEERLLPAVVVRCVQHLLTWGIQEEGLFRMNGRSSHIRDLRSEFDQGVDYDISECAPCDMDPHVVSSLFKLYLREMPEPLLTRELMPYFDAVMAAEDSLDLARSHASQALVGMSEPTLPSGPKSDWAEAMHKPPSLSTLAMPNLAGMRSASQSSVYAIASLISRLPRENRDLLFTLAELMKATASHSKQTKMPLANLLLVFCPSLNMKPSLLRILCESDDIWRGPPNTMENAVPIVPILDQDSMHSRESSLDSIDDSPRPGAFQLGNPIGFRRGLRRGPIATMHGNFSTGSSLSDNTPPETASDTMSYEDDSSDISFPDVLHFANTDPGRASSPPLSSSVESLATPSTSSEGPTFVISPAKDEPYISPVIADQIQLSLHPSPRAAVVSSPVIFPYSTGTTPSAPLYVRKSSPNLSTSITTARLERPSHPSLHIFSKKSASSLRSLSQISHPIPHSGPADAQHAAQPPSLNITINSSPIRLQFEHNDSHKPELRVVPTLGRLQSSSSATTDSPISAFYATPTGSFVSISSEKTTEPHDKYVRSASRLSVALGSEGMEGDWTRSVLQAVDIDSDQSVAGQR